MEYQSMGQMIQSLRREKGLTQRQLADVLNITDKAVSKWERDVSCPDTTVLPKLSEILGVTAESLLNAKIAMVSDNNTNEIADDANPYAKMYSERAKQLLSNGRVGFLIGFVLMFVLFLLMQSSQENGVTFRVVLVALLMALITGLMFAGVPYGWRLLNRFLGQWSIFSSIPVLFFLFGFKFAFSVGTGAFVYPIILIYNVIRSQKTKHRVKMWTIIAISAVVLWYVFIGVSILMSQ